MNVSCGLTSIVQSDLDCDSWGDTHSWCAVCFLKHRVPKAAWFAFYVWFISGCFPPFCISCGLKLPYLNVSQKYRWVLAFVSRVCRLRGSTTSLSSATSVSCLLKEMMLCSRHTRVARNGAVLAQYASGFLACLLTCFIVASVTVLLADVCTGYDTVCTFLCALDACFLYVSITITCLIAEMIQLTQRNSV